jgi:PAS domain S-box-containing protein
MPLSIMIIEDDTFTAYTIGEQLKYLSYHIQASFATAEEALEYLLNNKQNLPDIIFMDIQLAGQMSGIEAAHEISKQFDSIVIYLTKTSENNFLDKAIATKPYGYLIKPVDITQLKVSIRMAIQQKCLEKNILEQKKELEASRENLKSLFDTVDDFIIITKTDGQIIAANPSVEKQLQITNEKVEQMHFNDLIPQEHHNMMTELYTKLQTHHNVLSRMSLLKKNGEKIPVETKITKGKWNGMSALYHISRDYTETMKAEKAILDAKEAAETANNAKSDFIANMSHEFRTPMQLILHCAKSGEKKYESLPKDKIYAYFKNIHEAGNRLLPLLNDLLDLSRLESGKHSYLFKTALIEPVIDIAISELKQMFTEKNIQPVLKIKQPQLKAYFDSDKIVLVLQNIISNAIRFSPKNSKVYIYAHSVTDDIECSDIKISIKDQGIGVPEKEHELIFDKFFLSSRTRIGSGGIGLGLAICKRIIHDHGGTIWVENNHDKGVTVNFILRASYLTL